MIAIGGAIGALARWGVTEAIPDRWSLPIPTLFINVLGSVLLAFLLISPLAQRWWSKPLIGTGILGGFTTFSAVMAQVQFRINDGNLLVSTVYLALMLSLSLGCVGLILRLARR